jgi:DNA-directed RNA polymerase specialized sigma24 family protein
MSEGRGGRRIGGEERGNILATTMMTETAPDHLSANEARAAIEALSEADLVRLTKVAKAYARNRRLDPDDLLQEAFTRAPEGSRRCPRGVGIVRFLAEAMRSIASDELKARARKPELHLVPETGGGGALEFDIAAEEPTAEDMIASREQVERITADVVALFDDDLIAKTIVEGGMEEMESEELRALTDLDKTAYASKRRLIRRRIDVAFPKGWTL